MCSLLFFFFPLSLWLFSGISSLISCATVTAEVLAQERCQEHVARGSSFFSLSPQSGQNQLEKNSLRKASTGLQSRLWHSSPSRNVDKRLGWAMKAALTTSYGDASSCCLNGAWEAIQKPSSEHISFSKIAPQRWSCTFVFSSSFLKNFKHGGKRVHKMLV